MQIVEQSNLDLVICFFFLSVIAKITTECLIVIGCLKISVNLIGCHKSCHIEQNGLQSLQLHQGGLGTNSQHIKRVCALFMDPILSPVKVLFPEVAYWLLDTKVVTDDLQVVHFRGLKVVHSFEVSDIPIPNLSNSLRQKHEPTLKMALVTCYT